MTKRCIIVGAGEYFGIPFELRKDDFIIAADGGYEILKKEHIVPDLCVGDFDSMHVDGVKGSTGPVKNLDIFSDAEKADYLNHLEHRIVDDVPFRVIDPVKNDPDMLACVRIGIQEGCNEFHLLGGTGNRIDHSIANLQILAFLSRQGMHGYLYNARQIITAITNESVQFGPEHHGYFSALSFSDECHGVTETGFKYIIHDVTLNNLMPTGLSNEFVGTNSEICVKTGTLLLIYDQPML